MNQFENHQQVLLDKLVEEFTARLRRGERPAISEFSQRHPSAALEIEELLTSVAMIEELKSLSGPTTNGVKRDFRQILKLHKIGDYRVVRELGRGGMGIVFEAEHESLGRRVAIKVMPNRAFDDQKYLERFKREAQAAANLHHTNIVSVFGIGQTGDHYYYVMEFVDGESLANILSRLNGLHSPYTENLKDVETSPAAWRSDPARADTGKFIDRTLADTAKRRKYEFSAKNRYRWAAEVGVQIADGLAYAHAMGTLHRDIKPSNLLVDKHETVWLTDFGLVKSISGQSITKTGDIVGTPQYMAPESFEGQYDERSETYCLGLTLYEMATLHPAYENASTPELIRRITTISPPSPRKLDRRIPRDLDRIIQKAISREPAYRYQRAAELRDDLRAFLDDRPISARQISFTENVWRLSKRNPVSTALAVATALVICLSAITATYLLQITNLALIKSGEKTKSLEVEQRVTSIERRRAEETIDFTVDSFDEMFRQLVFKGKHRNGGTTPEGFADLAGSPTTVNEKDAVFLDQMLQFYLQFAEKNQHNMTLKLLTAKAFRRVANIYHLNGEFDQAVETYKRSINVYQELVQNDPESVDPTLGLVGAIKECGWAIEMQGMANGRVQAQERYQQAIQILRDHPSAETPELQIELAKSLVLVGSLPSLTLPQLPNRFEELRRWNSGGATNWFAPARTAFRGFVPVYRLEQPLENKRALEEALAIVTKLKEKQGVSEDLQFLSASALTRLATIQMLLEDFQKGLTSLRESERLLLKLKEENPDNPDYKFALVQNYQVVRPRLNVQLQYLTKAKKVLVALAAKYDRNLDYLKSLADVCYRIGILHLENDDWEAAERNLVMASESFQQLLPQASRNRSIQASGLSCLLQLVDVQLELQEYDQAVSVLTAAITDSRQVQRDGDPVLPTNFYYRKNLYLYLALAIAHKESGNFIEAIRAKQKALDFAVQPVRRNRQAPLRRMQTY